MAGADCVQPTGCEPSGEHTGSPLPCSAASAKSAVNPEDCGTFPHPGDVVRARYTGQGAEVRIGTASLARTFQVDRRDDEARVHTCPLELVSAALSS